MNLKKVTFYLLSLFAAAVGFVLILLFFAWITRPDLSDSIPAYSREQVESISRMRKTPMDPNHPLVVYRPVNYEEGKQASWYPRHEAPLLTDLVRQGLLPPVDQRTGPEPVVVEGVDGIGTYGGTWYRVSPQSIVPEEIISRLSYVTLVRWSPQGYPIVPHVAKAFEVSADNREFIFHLRKGMRWSDGHPFTADDILFWWKYIANEKSILAEVPGIMKVQGRPGKMEKIDTYTFKITFPFPNGIFLAQLASDGMNGGGETYANMLSYPAHYLRPYHPMIGDPDIIRQRLEATGLQNAAALFRNMLYDVQNYPDYPRLWPWIYRKYQASPPYSLVRNPYYWMVDTQGHQLPYIDSLVFTQRTQEMIPIAAANGEVSMQLRYIPFEEYTHLMSQAENSGYEIYHWYSGDRSQFLMTCNLNYRIDPDKAESRNKHALLNNPRFRQALSLAIHRENIIRAEYSGMAEPAQCAPGPESYFYNPELYTSFTRYDPAGANQRLDEIGLRQRDSEGYRTYQDGRRMTFYLNVASSFGSPGIVQMVVDDWAEVGIRAIPRFINRRLFYIEAMSLQHDLNVWMGNSEFLPVISPRYFVPSDTSCYFAIGYARWYYKGGLYGDPASLAAGCIPPPPDSDCRKVMELYDGQLRRYSRPEQQKKVMDQILRINAGNLWTINISTPPPTLVIVNKDLKNVPRTAVSCWEFKTPGNAGLETYFFEHPAAHPGHIREMQDILAAMKMPPNLKFIETESSGQSSRQGARFVQAFIRLCLLGILLFLFLLAVLRHPFLAKRILIMIPTLLIVSVLIFIIIQAPPGDYVTSRIMMLQEMGDASRIQEVKDLREMFWLDQPVWVQYGRWMGLKWFVTFDSADKGLLQGHLGRTMDGGRSVNDLVGDRILLTILISLGSILLTWSLAFPIGIYSAVKQYSLGDYIITLFGFMGMCIPPFLLALIAIYACKAVFGVSVSGLFSSEYGVQPHWDWNKGIDLLKHIWLPIAVLSIGGTAGMIRILRGNLLDELKKPYVITAKAKGLRPVRLLFRYPVRLALNPFVSGIGALFPQLISGGAIVAVVLSLPTVGPMMLDALMIEDMYLAGSMLMVLSLLGVVGTLISDLLLLWLDPRIRFRTGTR